MFDNSHRHAATRSGFVKVRPQESMRFRVLRVYPVENVPADRAQNGPYDVIPLDVELLAHSNAEYHNAIGQQIRWEPAADKVDGMIKISDELARRSGNPQALLDVVLDVAVTEQKNPKSGRWFQVFTYTLATGSTVTPSGAPVLPPTVPAGHFAPPATPPAAPAGPAAVNPREFVGTCAHAFAGCGDLGSLKDALKSKWQHAVALAVTAEVLAAYNVHKSKILTESLRMTTSQPALDAAWQVVATETARDAGMTDRLAAVYRERAAQFTAAPSAFHDTPAAPSDDAIPF